MAVVSWSRHTSFYVTQCVLLFAHHVQFFVTPRAAHLVSSYDLLILTQQEASPNPNYVGGLLKEIWTKQYGILQVSIIILKVETCCLHALPFKYGTKNERLPKKLHVLSLMFKILWVLIAQLCLTLCNPIDCSPLGSSVHGVFQARILEWVAISFSRGSSWPRDQTQVSCIAGRLFVLSVQFSSVQLLSCVWLFADPWIAARQASLSITISQNSLKLTSIESVMPSSHLILCCPFFLLPPIPPFISLFQWVNSLHEVAKVL